MRNIPNTNRSHSFGETSWETGDFADAFTGRSPNQILIDNANSIPLTLIFNHYSVHLNSENRKTRCPFQSHKGGREATPSFVYYPETNTYHCFGCCIGSTCCDFVAEKDKISKINAARKILELFGSDGTNSTPEVLRDNFEEQLEIIVDFSNHIREFRKTYPDKESFLYIENICSIYDSIFLKYKKSLNNTALSRAVQEFKNKISAYKMR